MNNLHLFAGIGGGILADVILGNTIAGAVEISPYCRELLKQKQKQGLLNSFPVFDDVRSFECDEFRGKIDTVCGGFPCQDISAAGAGAGINGEQSRLFYELVRVCGIVEPRFIFLENSPLITSRGLDTVLKKIAEIGYDAQWSTLSAGAVGAPHMRNRWWCVCKRQDVEHADVVREVSKIEARWRLYDRVANKERHMANTEGEGLQRVHTERVTTKTGEPRLVGECANTGTSAEIENRLAQFGKNSAPSKNVHISNTKSTQRVGASDNANVVETSRARLKHDSTNDRTTAYTARGGGEEYLSINDTDDSANIDINNRDIGAGWWKVEPGVCRVVNEFPGRVDAIRGLGNAQVPIVAALAFYLLLSRFCEV